MCNVHYNYRPAVVEPSYQRSYGYEQIHAFISSIFCILIYEFEYTLFSIYMYLDICLYPSDGLPLSISSACSLAHHACWYDISTPYNSLISSITSRGVWIFFMIYHFRGSQTTNKSNCCLYFC